MSTLSSSAVSGNPATVNRVALAIRAMRQGIQDKLNSGEVTPAQVEKARKAFDMDYGEYAKFQELKSLAVANGTMTLDEGQTVYAILGQYPATFNRQPAAVKAVLTKLFASLLQ